MVDLYETRKKKCKDQMKKAPDVNQKFIAHEMLQRFPRNSSEVRLNRRCLISGRPKAVYRTFGLSRHVFREMAHQGLLPGVTKSSW